MTSEVNLVYSALLCYVRPQSASTLLTKLFYKWTWQRFLSYATGFWC